jgi:hypothetical protein
VVRAGKITDQAVCAARSEDVILPVLCSRQISDVVDCSQHEQTDKEHDNRYRDGIHDLNAPRPLLVFSLAAASHALTHVNSIAQV